MEFAFLPKPTKRCNAVVTGGLAEVFSEVANQRKMFQKSWCPDELLTG